MNLILSLFPGIDLFGRGFERAGFCVVRGPDVLWGQDIRTFHVPPKRFEGVIGGPPCQEFSKKNRKRNPSEGMEMLQEFARVVQEAEPTWFLMENVPEVPDIEIPNYMTQRLALNANECHSQQNRNRHFQFGSLDGRVLSPKRASAIRESTGSPTVLASEGKTKERRTWADVCELQGLPRDFDLPGWSLEGKYRAVGNGVNVEVAHTLAQAILAAEVNPKNRFCACGCGRVLEGRKDQKTATASCRSRYRYMR